MFVAASQLIALISLWICVVQSADDKYTCPHGWTRYGNRKCLKYVNELLDYEKAQAVCRTKNQGNLVTIHSHDEQNFVYSYIHSIAASSTPIWLGAKQIDFESILWLDKIETSYTNWAPSEPSHPDEICIAINPRNGMWHDVMCTDANVPACERAPTTQWPFFVAFCSEGWFQFNDEKCVRIISSQALNFYESQELCRSKYNSKLLSIKTDKESEFVHNLMKFRDVKLPVWLGAIQNDFSSFNWIDKSDVTFTNWAEGEPNDPDHACLSMTASSGKWSDNDCKEQKLILCQNVPEDGSCETGWLQFRQDKCYRFVHIRLSFDDAESLCNNLYGGHLPSIHSQEEQFMISQFLSSVNVKNGSEIWLGGRQMDFHNFNWGDGSLFNYSYWEHGEPSFPTEKCIEMSWRNGRWNDISCRLKRAVLCERQVTTRSQYLKPNLYQPTTCLDPSQNCSHPTGGQFGAGSGQPAPTTTAATSSSPLTGHASDVHQTSAGSSPSRLAPQPPGELATGNGSIIPLPAPVVEVQTAPVKVSASAHPAADSVQSSNSTPSQTPDLFSSQPTPISASTPTDEQVAPKVNNEFIMAPDDRPIKVIASIMHREQQSPQMLAESAIVGKAAPIEPMSDATPLSNKTNPSDQQQTGNASTTEFIHYNLPQPDQFSDSVSERSTTLAGSKPEASTVDTTAASGLSGEQSSATVANTEKQIIPEVKSLLDKLKPSQSQDGQVAAGNSSAASGAAQEVSQSTAAASDPSPLSG